MTKRKKVVTCRTNEAIRDALFEHRWQDETINALINRLLARYDCEERPTRSRPDDAAPYEVKMTVELSDEWADQYNTSTSLRYLLMQLAALEIQPEVLAWDELWRYMPSGRVEAKEVMRIALKHCSWATATRLLIEAMNRGIIRGIIKDAQTPAVKVGSKQYSYFLMDYDPRAPHDLYAKRSTTRSTVEVK